MQQYIKYGISRMGYFGAALWNALSNTLSSFWIFILFFLTFSLILLTKTIYFLHSEESLLWGIYSFFTSVFLLSRLPLSYFYQDSHSDSDLKKESYPSVSFVISAKNEEGVIYDTIKSVVSSRYPSKIECIVVNDGSTDRTEEMIKQSIRDFGEDVHLISFDKHRGKREAMAEGVLAARHEVIVFVDSDSFLNSDAARIIVEHFITDKTIGAVSGNTHVENSKVNTLTRMQSIRYAVSFDIFKTAEGMFGTVTCCPGCFSAYRKEALLPVLNTWRNQTFFGSRGTFGDDRSLTNFVLKTWKVHYCKSALATTIVPETYKKFFKQQLRWKKSWIREGIVAASFMWKKQPAASFAFYMNFIIPLFGPILVLRLFYKTAILANPLAFGVFILGMVLMGALFSLYLKMVQREKLVFYLPLFSLLYMFVLVWQMPYALIRITDTKWGTR